MAIRQIYQYGDQEGHAVTDPFKFCPVCAQSLALMEVGDRSRLTCPRCGFIRFRNPAPAVSLLIVNDRRVLLGKRSGEPGKQKWASVSGYIEYGEDFLATAVREAKEETGLEVEIQAILNVASSFVSPRYHFFSAYLLASVVGGELAAGDDMQAVAWFSLDEPLPELAFQEDREVIEAYAAGKAQGLPVNARPWTPTEDR